MDKDPTIKQEGYKRNPKGRTQSLHPTMKWTYKSKIEDL